MKVIVPKFTNTLPLLQIESLSKILILYYVQFVEFHKGRETSRGHVLIDITLIIMEGNISSFT